MTKLTGNKQDGRMFNGANTIDTSKRCHAMRLTWEEWNMVIELRKSKGLPK